MKSEIFLGGVKHADENGSVHYVDFNKRLDGMLILVSNGWFQLWFGTLNTNENISKNGFTLLALIFPRRLSGLSQRSRRRKRPALQTRRRPAKMYKSALGLIAGRFQGHQMLWVAKI